MTLYQNLSPEELIEKLSSRGMHFKNKQRAQQTIQHISYYKIKEFAEPYIKLTKRHNKPDDITYQSISFENVISRYYQDKNFRLHMLHALEDIEVALQTQISSVLGETTGDYGYLLFNNWVDHSTYSKKLIERNQFEIKREIRYQAASLRNSDRDLNDKLIYGSNPDYPPVWKAVTLLMFGSLVQMIEIMSNRNISKIAQYFNCTNDELISWMRCLNLIRNVSAHNSNLIDLTIKTPPLIRPEWDQYLYQSESTAGIHRIALPILILRYLMQQINPRYQFDNIRSDLQNLIKNDLATANYLGFKSVKTVQEIFPFPKSRKQRHKKSRKGKSKRRR